MTVSHSEEWGNKDIWMYVEEGEKKSHLRSETQVSAFMCRQTANHRQQSVLWGSLSFRNLLPTLSEETRILLQFYLVTHSL